MWQRTADERLTDFKKNAVNPMSNNSKNNQNESLLLKMKDAPAEDDEDEKDQKFYDTLRKWGLCWLLIIFSIFCIGTTLLLLENSSEISSQSGRPNIPNVAEENIAEEAAEYGTTVEELASELKEEALEEASIIEDSAAI